MIRLRRTEEHRADPKAVLSVRGVPMVVVCDVGSYYAISAYCPHRGAPLADAFVLEGSLVCAWHRSQFRLRDGARIAGPAATGIAVVPLREEAGWLVIDESARQHEATE